MIAKYQPLFQLDVFHSYFQKGICSCLEFKQEIETASLLNRFGLVIRNHSNGIGLYADGHQSLERLLGDIEGATGQHSFRFGIRSNNPYFKVITELPPNWEGQFLYDSNNSSLLDHKVNLNQQLSVNDGTLCMGKVTVHFADILKFSDQNEFANFCIQYQARATQWQYFIINRSSFPLNAPSILGKDSFYFEEPKHVITVNGEAALLFSSGNNLIPLSEIPIHQFDLVDYPVSSDNGNIPPRIIIRGLPTPNPEQIEEGVYIYL